MYLLDPPGTKLGADSSDKEDDSNKESEDEMSVDSNLSDVGEDHLLVKAKRAERKRMAKALLDEWKKDVDVDQDWLAEQMADLKKFVVDYKQELDDLLKKEKKKDGKQGTKRDKPGDKKEEGDGDFDLELGDVEDWF